MIDEWAGWVKALGEVTLRKRAPSRAMPSRCGVTPCA